VAAVGRWCRAYDTRHDAGLCALCLGLGLRDLAISATTTQAEAFSKRVLQTDRGVVKVTRGEQHVVRAFVSV